MYNGAMNRVTKKCFLIIFAAIGCLGIFTAAGCTAKYGLSEQEKNIEIYTAADEESLWVDCYTYTTENADYYFETTLEHEITDAFIETAEQVLTDYPQDKAEFVVGTSFNTAYVGSIRNAVNTINRTIDKFYFNIDDLSHLDLLIELNAKKYGETTPYGLLYAYSYGQCMQSGYEVPKLLSDAELTETVNANRDITDLNAFVFLSSLTTETEKLAAQTLAVKIYELAGFEKLQEMVEAESVAEQQNILDFYVKYVCYDNNIVPLLPSGLADYECYHTQRYIVADYPKLEMRIFIAKDFAPFVWETHINDYAQLKECLLGTIEPFEQINEFIGNTTPLPVDFYFFENTANFGWFNNHRVEVDALSFMVHEYAHVAMFDKMRHGYWTIEAFAEYCDAKFGVYGRSEWILNLYIQNSEVDNEQVKQTLQLLKDYPPQNAMEMWDIYAYVSETLYPGSVHEINGTPNCLSEWIGISLSNYLVETYGSDKFLELCTTYQSELDIYSKTREELREEWFSALKQKFEKIMPIIFKKRRDAMRRPFSFCDL